MSLSHLFSYEIFVVHLENHLAQWRWKIRKLVIIVLYNKKQIRSINDMRFQSTGGLAHRSVAFEYLLKRK
jgi:hypothetical protein